VPLACLQRPRVSLWKRSSPCCALTCPVTSRAPRRAGPGWRALLPSVLAATGHDPGTPGKGPTAWLLAYTGIYLSSQGRSAKALTLRKRVLRINEAALGPDHPSVAIDLNEVGVALSEPGRSAKALPLHQRALRIDEAAFGPDHPFTRQCGRYIEELESSQ
jgi:tetratricopeptide (TPR) repeat protein